MQLRKATRKQAKLRIGVSGASGSGKTYSSLLIARGMASDWDKVALIDTENGSGDLYAHLGAYNVITLTAPFSPERYIEAIKACEEAGMEVIVIDSATHEWDGVGGCLEIAESITQRSTSKNSYVAWATVTPRHKKFLETILQSNCHIITTTRRKQDYDMSKNDQGKTVITKVGLKEVQREGFEYELTVSLNVDQGHYATVIGGKDRTGLFDGKPEFIISVKTGEMLKAWADSGEKEEEKTAFEKTKELIETVSDNKTLEGFIENIKKSEKLDAKEKVILIELINKKIAPLTETKPTDTLDMQMKMAKVGNKVNKQNANSTTV